MNDLHSADAIRQSMRQLETLFLDHYEHPEQTPLLQFKTKATLAAELADPTPPQNGIGLEAAVDLFTKDILGNAVKTWHPNFMNQMSAGAAYPTVLATALATMMNGTLSTFEASPAATIIERNVAGWMADLLGMKPGSGGIFLPGSSLGNFLALVLARATRLTTDCKRDERPPVVLCSDAAHYSIANAVSLMGLDRKNLVLIATNDANEILIDDFAEQIKRCLDEGRRPFAAVATLGLTVTGGFDPIAQMAEWCTRYDIHLHADAAFGGGMALTDRRDPYLSGIELADTVTWDAHKWLHAPLTTTVLLTPQPQILKAAFNPDAPYLFHDFDDQSGLTEDLGHFTPMCGKQFHALPIWLMFKAYGSDWFRTQAQARLVMVDAFAAEVKADPELELAFDPRSPVLCFRYRPKTACDEPTLNRLQVQIREHIRASGQALFNVSDIKGVTFFRLILINPLTTMATIRPILARIKELGRMAMDRTLPN